MSRFVHPDLAEVSLSVFLHALSDPARRAIVRALAACGDAGGKGLPCGAATPAWVPKATMSNHYAVLRTAGLIRSERRGVEVVNALRCKEVEKRFPGLLAAVLTAKD